MIIKTDAKGFPIADGPIDTASLAHGIDAVHTDTSAVLSLLRSGQRAALMKRQRIAIAAVVPPLAATAGTTGVQTPAAVASVPAIPTAPPAQTASIPVALTSDKPVEVRLTDDRAVGQGLQNRRLGQIATGGLSG